MTESLADPSDEISDTFGDQGFSGGLSEYAARFTPAEAAIDTFGSSEEAIAAYNRWANGMQNPQSAFLFGALLLSNGRVPIDRVIGTVAALLSMHATLHYAHQLVSVGLKRTVADIERTTQENLLNEPKE